MKAQIAEHMQPLSILICQAVLLVASGCFAADQTLLVYRGRLLSGGSPANGSYDVKVAVSDSEIGGRWLGQPITNAATPVREGAFSINIDSARLFLDGSPRWLEIGVRSNGTAADFTVLSPRQPLASVPHSAFATTAATATSLADGGSTLTAVPAASLFGMVPLGSLPLINSNQIYKATDAIYRDKTQRGIVTPFDCGAVGDGVHDDTAALQTMINRACLERAIAFLAPAPGGFYKITDTLYASHSLTMIGAGGAKHVTSDPVSRSVIKQFTPGRHGLVLATANDSVHLASFIITAEPANNWTRDCYGIWFAGGAPDADCSIVEQCLVSNFGVGVEAASQADSTFRQCSFGNNGIGIRISGVANNVSLDSCQLSYNVLRQADIQAGKVLIHNSDIAAGADGTTSSQGVYCFRPDLTIIGSRFEDYTTNACLIALPFSRITLIATRFLDFSHAWRYSVVLTNALLTTINSTFECLGYTGVPIFDSGIGRSSVYAIPPVKEVVSIGSAWFINTASVFTSGRSAWTGAGPGPGGMGRPGWAYPGSLEWEDTGSEHSLWAFGHFSPGELKAVDLLAFAKQQRSGLQGNGSGLTNLSGANISPGTITAKQIDSQTDAIYRERGLTNNHSAPVSLRSDVVIGGDLQVIPGSLVIRTNSAPGSTAPAAWFEVKTSDGAIWKVPLHK